ncbi:unnamed protein product [Linum tenue]|uniref:Secreted protein n=1 Tax=Linum tenue TaxID=586396 RepID=A0AAV0LZ04_9ROSI|nr:unnamed protein product [Linum tenue]
MMQINFFELHPVTTFFAFCTAAEAISFHMIFTKMHNRTQTFQSDCAMIKRGCIPGESPVEISCYQRSNCRSCSSSAPISSFLGPWCPSPPTTTVKKRNPESLTLLQSKKICRWSTRRHWH